MFANLFNLFKISRRRLSTIKRETLFRFIHNKTVYVIRQFSKISSISNLIFCKTYKFTIINIVLLMKNHCLFRKMLFRIKKFELMASIENFPRDLKRRNEYLDNFILIYLDNVQWFKHDQKIVRNIIFS